MSDGRDTVRRLVDERKAELMARLDALETLMRDGEGEATWTLELTLLENELRFLKSVLEAMVADVEQGRRWRIV